MTVVATRDALQNSCLLVKDAQGELKELSTSDFYGTGTGTAVTVVNNLNSSDTGAALSAAQGKLLNDNKASNSDLTDNIGKGLQIDMTGTLSSGVITFTANSGETVTFANNKDYELDLVFPAVGTIAGTTTMRIVDSNNNEIMIVNPIDSDPTTHATFASMAQVCGYDTETGFRWIFNARYNESGTVKALTLPATVVNPQAFKNDFVRLISNEEMLNAITTPTYRGLEISNGDLFVCSDDNGYLIGHIYQFTVDSTNPSSPVYDWKDCA